MEHGAEVVGIDLSPKMVRLAEERLRGQARIVLADLGKPLDFLESELFDLVVSSLVLDSVEDWASTFGEFFRALKAPGHFVFSVGHPFDEFFEHHPGGSYFDVEGVEYPFSSFGQPIIVPYYRRPLGAMIDALVDGASRWTGCSSRGRFPSSATKIRGTIRS